MRAKLINIAILAGCLVMGAVPGIIGAQIGPTPEGPVDYGPTIQTNTDKLDAVYSLIRQMVDEYNRQAELAGANPGKYAEKFRHYTWVVFDPALQKLLREYNRLKGAILEGTYTDKTWADITANMTVEEANTVEYNLWGNRTLEEAKDTVAEYGDLDDIKAVTLDELEPMPGFDPVEDFTTYTEVDEGADLTVDSNTIDFVGAVTRGDTFYVYDDKGVDHFDGDFEHRVKHYIDEIDSSGAIAYWYLANAVGDCYDVKDGYSLWARREWAAGYQQIYRIWEWDSATAYWDTFFGGSKDVEYFVTIVRDWDAESYGTLTAYVCEDNYYGESSPDPDLLCTLSLDLHTQVEFRYVYGCGGYDDGGSATATGYVEDLDLQEGAGPTWTGYAFGYVLGG